ncbi:40S ribosomal protein S2 [Plecturocebus cupreus]
MGNGGGFMASGAEAGVVAVVGAGAEAEAMELTEARLRQGVDARYQKQIRAVQCTRFKVFVAIGDYSGHVGLGVKCSTVVAIAIRGTINLAKLSIVPVHRGYWGNKISKPHTVPCKVTGSCGSVLATSDVISKTYSYLTPDLWKETVFTKSSYLEFTDHFIKTYTKVSLQRIQAPAVATR